MGLNDVVAVEGGYYHSLALRRDGTVAAWGGNGSGQRLVPTNLYGVIAIAAGNSHSLALRQDGSVVAWGNNAYGQRSVPQNLSGVVAIAAGEFHSLALKGDGTVVAWGLNSDNQVTVPTNLGVVVSIAGGDYHSLALKADGSVAAWGLNNIGQCLPPQSVTGVVAIAGGGYHSLALKRDGMVVGWGNDSRGQNEAIAISAGETHSLSLKGDGTVVAWGAANPCCYYQTVVPSDLSGVTAIAAGAEHNLALLDNRPPYLFRSPTGRTVFAGSDVVWSAAATGATPLHYQWRKGATNLIGQTNSFLGLTNVQLAHSGAYSVVVTNPGGSTTGQIAWLMVDSLGKPKVFVDGEMLSGIAVSVRSSATVSLSTTFPSGTLLFTLNGSDPSISGKLYAGPFVLRQSATLRAVAYNADFTQSVQSDPVEIVILPTLSATTAGGGSVAVDPPAGAYHSNGTATVMATPAPGWSFLQWLGDAAGTNPVATLSMSRNRYAQAVFGTSLTNTVVGSGSVVRSPDLPLYPYGTTVRLSTVPQPGNYFAFWGNAASGTNNPLNFTVTNANATVTAVFAALPVNQHSLTVLADGPGAVMRSPAANRFNTGATVSLMAMPEAGQSFLNWTGDAGGMQNPLTVTMNSSKVITAHFTKRPRLEIFTCGGALDPANVPLQLHGEPGQVHYLGVSSNLIHWSALATVTNIHGTVQWNDRNGGAHRFYQAVEPPPPQ